MTLRAPHDEFEERRAPALFWIYAGIGIAVMFVAWAWKGFAILEEATEQGKAEAAGTTMEGFAALFGVVPLIITHAIGLVLLLIEGWRCWRAEGLIYGLSATMVASLLGVGGAHILFDGQLFWR